MSKKPRKIKTFTTKNDQANHQPRPSDSVIEDDLSDELGDDPRRDIIADIGADIEDDIDNDIDESPGDIESLGDFESLGALAPGLYLLPSPLGNLSDLSLRFIAVISRADIIAAEDTRRTLKILNHLGLKKRVYSYREENHRSMSPTLLRHLEAGDIVALVTDAGAPGICDPGSLLVSEVRKAGQRIYPIPGPSAVVTALMASGFEASKFSFLGFLPPKREARRESLQKIQDRPEVLVIFIPPHKLVSTLEDLTSILGPRPALMAREMTKIHEEYLALPLDALLAEVTLNPRRGEVTLVVGPPDVKTLGSLAEEPLSERDLKIIEQDTRPTKEAAIYYSQIYGRSKKTMYELILEIREKAKSKNIDDV
jgi:16S rRNA (cytidine1402-2'-O)-methyltransferase